MIGSSVGCPSVWRIIALFTWLGCVSTAPAKAAPIIDAFPLPGGNSTPVGVTVGDRHALWFTDPGTEIVGRIDSSGALSIVPLPFAGGPVGIAAQGDSVWVTLNDRGSLGRISQEAPHAFEELVLPAPAAQPFAITAGRDGDVWFTELGANQIARHAADETISEFTIPTALSLPAGIAVDAVGAVWFTQFNRNQIGRRDPSGVIEELALPNPGSAPFGIAAADDGVWFTELNGNRIGHIDDQGILTEMDVPTTASQPAGIAIGPDGAVWFTLINAGTIGRVVDGEVVEIDVGDGIFASGTLFSGGIVGGPGEQISFAASAAASIQSVTTCVNDVDCTSGNCDDSQTGLCGPAHTPTPVGSLFCQSDEDCDPGFFCNTDEGRICCDMRACPVGFTCRLPGREGFCTALPTASPSATPTATPSLTPVHTHTIGLPPITPTFTATLPPSPSLTPRTPEPSSVAPTSTPTGAGGGDGCSLNGGERGRAGAIWSTAALLTLLGLRRRIGRIVATTTCLAAFAWAPAATAQVGGVPQEPTPTVTAPPTQTSTPSPTATASSTRAATATPHLFEIRIGKTVVGPGDAAHIAVSVQSTNTAVAAVAHEISFASDALSLGVGNCFLRPEIDKSLRADPIVAEEGTTAMRVVVQSSRNLAPIPDGLLYTCTFLVSPLALPGFYPIDSGLTVGFAADGSEIRNVRGAAGGVTVSLIGEPCTGDCDGSGSVTVDEILSGVGMALGVQGLGGCPQFDGDASGGITVDELVAAVENALNGCNLPPPPPPTPTPTSPPPRTAIFVRMNGNDANSGLTTARALRTISQAARIVPSGYRVVVGPGVYVEGVTTDGQGRAPENVFFFADSEGTETGDPPGAVVIDASESNIAAGFRLTRSGRTVIDGFTITGAKDGGIVIKSDSDDFVVRNCTVFGNPGAGIRVQDSARALIFNNLVYNNGREGIAIVGQGNGSPDALVINNTVLGNADRALRVGTSQRGSPGALVLNNIFQGNGVGFIPPIENVKVFPASEPDYEGDFNLVFPATYIPFDIAGEHDIPADAELVSVAEGDFRLTFTSLAVDAGVSLPTDLQHALSIRSATGTNLDDGPPDLGYHFPP